MIFQNYSPYRMAAQKFSIYVLVFGATLNLCCCNNNKTPTVEKKYFESGELKSIGTFYGNLLDGPYTTYYLNGKMQYKANWVLGRLTGPLFSYYNTGILSSKAQMKDGKRNGMLYTYYRNGSLKERVKYSDDLRIGTTMVFDSVTRKPAERQLYDNKGRLFFMNNYDNRGYACLQKLFPIIDAPDTIQLGEKYEGTIRFGYPVLGEAKLIIGPLVERVNLIDRYQIIDTISSVKNDSNGMFRFSYMPRLQRVGAHRFTYKFIQNGSIPDSLNVNLLSGSRSFFIKRL